MGNMVIIDEDYLDDTGLAIQEKLGTTNKYNPSEFGNSIRNIQTGGGSADFEVESENTGTLKKHLASYSIDSLSLLASFPNPGSSSYVYFLPCKSTDDVTLDRILISNSSASIAWTYSAIFSKRQMTPIATADDEALYDVNDYQINKVGTTTFSAVRTIGVDSVSEAFTITIANSTADDITVKCIRFRSNILQGLQTYGQTTAYTLLYSYYLKNPITVSANGGTHQLTITLKKTVGN